MKKFVLLALLALASCGVAPTAADDATVTESELVTYPSGTVCPVPPVQVGYFCAPLPNRTMRCYTSWGEQVVGCKWPVSGPISYYRLCVLAC